MGEEEEWKKAQPPGSCPPSSSFPPAVFLTRLERNLDETELHPTLTHPATLDPFHGAVGFSWQTDKPLCIPGNFVFQVGEIIYINHLI